jgi:hypothetical protein
MKCFVALLLVCFAGFVSGQNFNSRSSFSPSSSSSFSRSSSFSPSSSSSFSSRSSSFSPSSSSSFSRPSQASAPRQSSENLCMLRNFAEDKCRSGGSSCKRCVVDTVERSCPYYADKGPPNCSQLQSCAMRLSFNC